MPNIIDITHPIHPDLAVWPGDTPYAHQWVMHMSRGDTVNVSTITMSAHTGTHADAPLHYRPQGATIGVQSLAPYIGLAQVIEIPITGPIGPDYLTHYALAQSPRLLLKTPVSQRVGVTWQEDIAYLTPDAVDYIADLGICLLGVDAASVDPVDSKTLDTHHALARHNIANLENLALHGVEPGLYELIALPLALPTDGSPLRAILRTLD